MSYCDQAAVDVHLRVHRADLEDTAMFGSAAQVDAQIRALLPTTKGMVDVLAGRDFDNHAAEVVYIDGDGESDTLFMGDIGKSPIISVSEITVDGDVVTATDYTFLGDYADAGMIRKVSTDGYESGGAWESGVRNIKVTLTYGYATAAGIPIEIRQAQAMLTAAMILGQGSGAGSGGVSSISIGAFSVSYGANHAWAPIIQTWVETARAACAYRRRRRVFGAG